MWLDNTVTIPDPHPCTAGNKEDEHTLIGYTRVLYAILVKKFNTFSLPTLPLFMTF